MATNPTLTQNWVSYATAVWDYGLTKITYYLEAKYSDQDTINNQTNVQTRLRCELNYGSASGTSYIEFGCSYANTVSGTYQWDVGSEVITEGSSTITHNADGTKTLNLTGKARVDYLSAYGTYNSDLSATIDLPTIPRVSTLTSASMSISSNGNTVTVTPVMSKASSSFYDNLIIKNGSSTLMTLSGVTNGTAKSLSSSQITSLYSAIGTSTSKTFTCYLQTKTSSSGTEVGTSDSVNLVATLPSYSLSNSVSVADSISTYNTYKPNNSTYIVGLSKPIFTFSATSSTGSTYGRTITYTINNVTQSSPYTENNYTGQSFTIKSSDGRKSKSTTPSMTAVNYFQPSINTTVTRPNPTGSTVSVSVSGTLYDGTGLTNLLTPSVSLTYQEVGGSETTVSISNLSYTTSGTIVSFTGSTTLSNMDYFKAVSWSTTLTDKIGITKTNSGTLSSGILPPWNVYVNNGTNYFNVNGILTVNNINPFEYSTSETIVGIYRDGNTAKPIYRKVCTIAALPSTAGNTTKYDVGITNADFVVNCYGSCSNGNWINAYRCDSASAAIEAWYDTDTQRMTITVGKDRSSLSAKIVVEYTKSTD